MNITNIPVTDNLIIESQSLYKNETDDNRQAKIRFKYFNNRISNIAVNHASSYIYLAFAQQFQLSFETFPKDACSVSVYVRKTPLIDLSQTGQTYTVDFNDNSEILFKASDIRAEVFSLNLYLTDMTNSLAAFSNSYDIQKTQHGYVLNKKFVLTNELIKALYKNIEKD